MNSERTLSAGSAERNSAFETRALDPSPAFWLAMYAASALGTVLGDFWAEGLSLGLWLSFGSLIVITALLIWGDLRRARLSTGSRSYSCGRLRRMWATA
jgi:uncharacterized membrane-anchored protein